MMKLRLWKNFAGSRGFVKPSSVSSRGLHTVVSAMFLAKKLSPLLILAGFALVGLFLRRPTGFLAGSLLKKPLEEAFAGSRWGFDLARRHQSDFQPPRRGG